MSCLIAPIALAWAGLLAGCQANPVEPARPGNAWSAERLMSPYNANAAQAVVHPAQESGLYELAREHYQQGEQEMLDWAYLNAGDPVGFEAINAFEAWAVAGSKRVKVRTTDGVRFVWYRYPTDRERLAHDVDEAIKTGGLAVALVSLWIGQEMIEEALGIDDED